MIFLITDIIIVILDIIHTKRPVYRYKNNAKITSTILLYLLYKVILFYINYQNPSIQHIKKNVSPSTIHSINHLPVFLLDLPSFQF